MEWQEARTPDSKVYWYNTNTRESVWTKPDVLKTPQEKAMDGTNWKEYEANGKKYYVHNQTNETTWDMPKEVSSALAAVPSTPVISAPNGLSPAPPPGFLGSQSPMVGGGALVGMGYAGTPAAAGAGPSALAGQSVQLWYNTPEEAAKAFIGLLRSAGVDKTWTWEQTMRTVVNDPLWKAVPTLGQRKAVFERYVEDIKRKEVESKAKNLDRIRPAWREGLGRASEGEGGMKAWWGWQKTKELLQSRYSDMWFMARNDEERKALWDEYVTEVKRKERQREDEMKARNLTKLDRIMANLDLGLNNTWAQVRRMVERSQDWQADEELQQLEPVEILNSFEDIIAKAEKAANEEKAKQKEARRRRIRKNREGFVELLEELKASGKITSGGNWADVYPLFQNDDRYQNLLGQGGSTPLELFWDVVDELDQKVEEHCRIIEGALAEKRMTVTKDTTPEQFDEMLQVESIATRARAIKDEDRKLVYQMLQDRLDRAAKDERRRQEKKLRAAQDDLRHALRKVEPEITYEATYEISLPVISQLPEFIALNDEDARKGAFDKHIQRLVERKEQDDRRVAEEAARAEEEAAYKARQEKIKLDNASPWPDSDGGSATSSRRHSSRRRSRRSLSRRADVEMDGKDEDLSRSSRKRSASPREAPESSERSSRRRKDHHESPRHSSRPVEDKGSFERSRRREHDEDDRRDEKRHRDSREPGSDRRSGRHDRHREERSSHRRERERSGRSREAMDVDGRISPAPSIVPKPDGEDGEIEEGEVP